jgi:hypothetical protein
MLEIAEVCPELEKTKGAVAKLIDQRAAVY